MAAAFSENSRFRVTWDAGIVVLILVSCTLVPFQLAFGLRPGGLGAVIVTEGARSFVRGDADSGGNISLVDAVNVDDLGKRIR